MQFTFTGTGTPTTPSQGVPAPTTEGTNRDWHLFVSGTFGAAGAVAVQYSPDPTTVADASSRWFSPAALSVNAAKDVYFTARPRKLRAVLTGGDSTTALIAEVV
jgi:hypothetical protein